MNTRDHQIATRSSTRRPAKALCLISGWAVLCALYLLPSPIGQEASPWASSALQPIWVGSHMSGETAFFVQEKGEQLATARLLFVPTKIIKVTSANGATTFREGQDYRWKRGTAILSLTPHSRIAFKTSEQLHPPKGSPMSLGEAVDHRTSLFFDMDGSVLQTIQVAVTYDHKEKWSGPVPRSATDELTRTVTKLKAKQSLKLVIFGDSISAGAGASGSFHAPPLQPPYTGLVVDGLRAMYGTNISLTNLSEGGQDSNWAATMAPKVAAEKPDLVIIAFGMNDAGRAVPAATFAHNIQKIIDSVRQETPTADFILVATMTGNEEWAQLTPALFPQYRDALSQMVGPGVALADVTSVWQTMVKSKKFLDLTGNGLNHPNDFGHCVYAQVVLQLLQ